MKYSYATIIKRLVDAIDASGKPRKAFRIALGVPAAAWSRKINDKGGRFQFDEIAGICEELGAPPGFPFIDWDYALALQAANASGQPRPPQSPSPAPVQHGYDTPESRDLIVLLQEQMRINATLLKRVMDEPGKPAASPVAHPAKRKVRGDKD